MFLDSQLGTYLYCTGTVHSQEIVEPGPPETQHRLLIQVPVQYSSQPRTRSSKSNPCFKNKITSTYEYLPPGCLRPLSYILEVDKQGQDGVNAINHFAFFFLQLLQTAQQMSDYIWARGDTVLAASKGKYNTFSNEFYEARVLRVHKIGSNTHPRFKLDLRFSNNGTTELDTPVYTRGVNYIVRDDDPARGDTDWETDTEIDDGRHDRPSSPIQEEENTDDRESPATPQRRQPVMICVTLIQTLH